MNQTDAARADTSAPPNLAVLLEATRGRTAVSEAAGPQGLSLSELRRLSEDASASPRAERSAVRTARRLCRARLARAQRDTRARLAVPARAVARASTRGHRAAPRPPKVAPLADVVAGAGDPPPGPRLEDTFAALVAPLRAELDALRARVSDLERERATIPEAAPATFGGRPVSLQRAAELIGFPRPDRPSGDAVRMAAGRARPGDPFHVLRPGGPGRTSGGRVREDAALYVAGALARDVVATREALEARKAAVRAAHEPLATDPARAARLLDAIATARTTSHTNGDERTRTRVGQASARPHPPRP